MKLSIIVPVYGVEKYILEFAQSLIKQLTSDVELIVIDDGSKDNSISILKDYIDKQFSEASIQFYQQENQGQSVARNYGISIAIGDYVTFLDPDDIVSNEYIHQIFDCMINNPDLINFNAKSFCKEVGGNKKIKKLSLVNDSFFIENNEIFLRNIYRKKLWFSWIRVIRREFLTNTFFPIKVNYQDMMAFPQLYKKVKSIKNLNQELVFYRIHSESSVNGLKPKLFDSANYGLELYSCDNDKLDFIIYKQFVDLRIDLEQKLNGFISGFYWYYHNIYLNSQSQLMRKKIYFLRTINKFFILSIYRFIKAKIK